jgi:hypothetical protein
MGTIFGIYIILRPKIKLIHKVEAITCVTKSHLDQVIACNFVTLSINTPEIEPQLNQQLETDCHAHCYLKLEEIAIFSLR